MGIIFNSRVFNRVDGFSTILKWGVAEVVLSRPAIFFFFFSFCRLGSMSFPVTSAALRSKLNRLISCTSSLQRSDGPRGCTQGCFRLAERKHNAAAFPSASARRDVECHRQGAPTVVY